MLKILLCMLIGLGVAVLTLELRQQRLNLDYQTNRLHNQIESSQAELWNQQLQIAVVTAPNAITKTVDGQQTKFVAPNANPNGPKAWIDNPDAAAE